jgi:Zn-dependent M28 family amino/carboxypeptidase
MIGDADLNIDHDANSTKWLGDLVYQAATNLSKKSYFYGRDTAIDDDHMPFLKVGVPAVDIIDLDYGYNNVYHHSPEDTIDKLSANSIQVVGDVVLETVRLLSNGAHQ